MRALATGLIYALALGFAAAANAGTQGTLTLDGLSFLAFDGGRSFPIPPGSTIRFRFADPADDGSVSFTIEPDDVAIAPIQVSEGTMLRYTLDAPIRGTMRREGGQRRVEFTAVLAASLSSPDGTSASTYSLRFTTESASATDAAQDDSIEVDGMRVVEGPNYVQLVGATTNRTDAAIEPGSAAYGVLSGSFDSIPTLP
jgi:hypothetical protein